jgi:hypothetical protein
VNEKKKNQWFAEKKSSEHTGDTQSDSSGSP